MFEVYTINNLSELTDIRDKYDNINKVVNYPLGSGNVHIDGPKTISPTALLNHYVMSVENDEGTNSSITHNNCQVNNYESKQDITVTGNGVKNVFETKHFSQINWSDPKPNTGFNVTNTSGTFSSSVTGHDDYRVTACELNEYTMTVNLGQGVDWVNVKIETPAYGYGRMSDGSKVYDGRNEVIKVTASGTIIKVNHFSKVTWYDSTAKTGYTIVTASGTHSNSITGTSTLTIPDAKLNEYTVTVKLNQGVVKADVSFSCGVDNYIRNQVVTYENPDPSHGTSVQFTIKANHFTKITYTGIAYEGYTLNPLVIESLTGDATFNITSVLNEYNLVVNLGQGIDFANVTVVNTVDNYNRNETIKVSNSGGSKTGVNSAATIKVRYYSSVTWTATAMTGWTVTQASGTHSTKITGQSTLNIPVATLNKYNITIEMGGDRYTSGTGTGVAEAYVENVGVAAVHVKEVNTITPYNTNKTTDVTSNGTVVVAYFDSNITLTAEPKTGYTITTLPGAWTMTGSVTKRIIATCNIYNITVNVPTGVASVTVKGSTVEGDRTFTSTGTYRCHHFDNLSWSAAADTGYCWNANNSLTTVSGTHTVSGATSIGPASANNNGYGAPGYKYYTITVNIGANTSNCVVTGSTYASMSNKTFSSTGTMTAYHFDTIRWTYTAVNGYHYSGSESAGWVNTASGSNYVTGPYTINDPGASINTYTVTVSYPANTASITAHGSSRSNGEKFVVNWGTTVSWTCTANTGYHYSGSESAGWVNTASGSTTVYSTTTIPNSAAGGSGGASINTYTVTIVYGANTASCTAAGASRANNSSFVVNYGTSVTATFTAVTGYHYSGSKPNWVNTHSKTVTVYSTTTITGDGASINYYDVTVSYSSPTTGCTADGGNRASGYSWTQNYGTTASATFSCATGYHYSGSNPLWSGTTNTVSTTVTGQTTLSPSVTPAINWYYVTASYTAYTASCTLNGTSVGNNGTVTVNYGGSCSVVFRTTTGYHYGSSNSNTTNSFTISNITSNVTAQDGMNGQGGEGARININTYSVTVTFGTGVASCTANGGTRSSGYSWTVDHGATGSVTFNAATGYHFGSSNSTTTHSHSYGPVTSNITISCTSDAAINQYSVTVTFGTGVASCTANGGTRSSGYSWTVNYGATGSVTFNAATGYHFGTNQSTTTHSHSYGPVTSNITISCTSDVVINTYTLSWTLGTGVASVNVGGSVKTSSGSATYNYGTSVSVSGATAQSHYTISSSGAGTYVMTQDRGFSVTATPNDHILTITADDGVKSFSPASGTAYKHDSPEPTATVTAEPKTGYKIKSGTGTYTMDQNRSISITTERTTCTVTVKFDSGIFRVVVNGTIITTSGSTLTYDIGSKITWECGFNTGYEASSGCSGTGVELTGSTFNIDCTSKLKTYSVSIQKNTGVASVSATYKGSSWTSGSKSVTHGDSVSWSSTASSGYTMNPGSGWSASSSTGTTVTSDSTISPTAKQDYYKGDITHVITCNPLPGHMNFSYMVNTIYDILPGQSETQTIEIFSSNGGQSYKGNIVCNDKTNCNVSISNKSVTIPNVGGQFTIATYTVTPTADNWKFHLSGSIDEY